MRGSTDDTKPAKRGDTSRRTAAACYGVTALILLLAVATGLSLDRFGLASRRFGEIHILNESLPPVLSVRTTAELHASWQASGRHGRVVVYLSRFLHFVPIPGNDAAQGLERLPVETFDLVEFYRQRINAMNVLWVAMQSGFARSVYHVLPPDELVARLAGLTSATPGIEVRGRTISTHEHGSPRVLADRLPQLGEPVLLGVDASFLRAIDSAEVVAMLRRSELASDLIVLCRADDNPDVEEAERRRLDELARQLGAVSR